MVSVTANRPLMQTSETPHIMITQYVGEGEFYMEGERRLVMSRDWTHTVNVYVSLFILGETFSTSSLK